MIHARDFPGVTPKEHQARKIFMGKTFEEQQKLRENMASIRALKQSIAE